jgi:hypothetical protein
MQRAWWLKPIIGYFNLFKPAKAPPPPTPTPVLSGGSSALDGSQAQSIHVNYRNHPPFTRQVALMGSLDISRLVYLQNYILPVHMFI